MDEKRIVSFLPSAPELIYELGAEDRLHGVTHECEYPIDAKNKPRVIESVFDPENMSSKEIDDKICWHDYSHGRSKIDPNLVTPEEKQALPPVKQKLVLRHNKHGKSLYLGAHCRNIDGMSANESKDLLAEINSYIGI